MTQATSASPGRLLSLDAMRGVAAIVVVLHHCEQNFQLKFGPGFGDGYIAVDLFFLISGFVIAGAYEAKMAAGLSVWGLLLVRLQRLYPMLVLGALLGGGIAFALGRFEPWALATLSSLTFLPLVWGDMAMYPINAVQWSVSVELIVNILHRLLVRRLGVRGLVALVALSFVLICVAFWRFGDVSAGWSRQTFWAGVARASYSYFIGVLIYRLHASGRLKVPTIPTPWILAAVVGLIMLGPVVEPVISPNAYWFVVVGVVFPAMMPLLVHSTLAPRFKGWARTLGDVSYPLYATHGPLIVISQSLMLAIDTPLRHWATLTLVLVFTLFAWGVERLYDRPVRIFLTRRRTLDQAVESAAP